MPAQAAPKLMEPISIVHTENSAGWGGQEIRILTEAKRMLERGHRIDLITPPGTPIASAAVDLGIPVTALPIARKTPAAIAAVRGFVASRKHRIDVLNTHSSTDSWIGALACLAMPRRPKIVRTRHVSTTVSGRFATRWLYTHGADHIVTTGEALKRQLIDAMDVRPERITSVPTGIDLTRFVPGDAMASRQALGLPQRPTLGIAATLRNWKGHEYLFEALAMDRDGWRDWDVLVIGDGPHRPNLETRVHELALTDKVRFANHQVDVVPWLQSLDLFVLPSYGEEGVPQAIMQAMACSLAVVSTPIGAIAEAVEDGVTGLLVSPRSRSALASGLARLRDDAALRARFGASGHARAQRDFGVDLMTDRMETVLRRVLGRPH
jgi:glycosyltransferase involved in cell wall biosynthesis